MILTAIIMIIDPIDSYEIILLILSIGFAIYGIRELIYYFSMARHMVGGKMSLYKGVIMLDFGLFSASLTDVPGFYILGYLVIIHMFSGLVDVLRANEERVMGAKSWKIKVIHGILDIMVGVLCIVFMRRIDMVVYIYSFGLIYSACIKIYSSLRKTEFIYIQ